MRINTLNAGAMEPGGGAARRVAACLAVVAAALALAGCATKLNPPITGYLCCNQTSYYDGIYASNVIGGSMVPLGTEVRIDTTKRKSSFWGTGGGTYLGFFDDVTPGSRNETVPREWINRIVVPQDPSIQLAAWPADVQNAVRARRVFPGMTREQVRMSLGDPSPADVRAPETATAWRYQTSVSEDALVLHFDEAGKVARIEGPAQARSLVQFVR